MIVSDSEFADSERLILDKSLVETLSRRRAALLTALRGEAPVYGVTTGMDRLAGVALDAAQAANNAPDPPPPPDPPPQPLEELDPIDPLLQWSPMGSPLP